MASVPPRQQPVAVRSNTRSADGGRSTSATPAETTNAYTSSHQVAESVESPETVLLDTSSPSRSTSVDGEQGSSSRQQREGTVDTVATTAKPDAPEPRKCWICYTDETEDSPHNSEWRSPCPCALTAHEACLLDWLAELESPQSRKRHGGARPLQCPQCRTEIRVARPRSYVVDFVRAVERLAGKLVFPGLVFTFAGTVWAGCCAHGVYSLYLVFGTEDAQRILERSSSSGTSDAAWSVSRNLGIPLIPLTLIFSRTRFADGLLPAIPVLFFATYNPTELEPQGGSLWPPSAAMTFAALPYVKSLYGALYERLFGKLERKWMAEVRPRHESGDEDGEDQNAALPDANNNNNRRAQLGDGQILMEIDLELQLGGGDFDEDDLELEQNQHNNDAAADQQNNNDNNNNRDARRQRQLLGRHHREELIQDTSSLADTILGALLFPAISAGMGGLLKMILPRSWTTPPPSPPTSTLGSMLGLSTATTARPGLLQTRWGRSVVGGCLFVLLRDAVLLYCRWRLAQTHRKRRILNYDRGKQSTRRTR